MVRSISSTRWRLRRTRRRRSRVLVVINDWIHGASSLTKTSTTPPDLSLAAVGPGRIVAYGDAEFYAARSAATPLTSEFSLDKVKALPRVDIIMAHENMDGALIEAAVRQARRSGHRGRWGTGNMTQAALDALPPGKEGMSACARRGCHRAGGSQRGGR